MASPMRSVCGLYSLPTSRSIRISMRRYTATSGAALMTDEFIGPYAAVVACDNLEEARAVRQAAAGPREFSDLEIIRIFGAVLRKAAKAVDVPHQEYGYDQPRLAEAIVIA